MAAGVTDRLWEVADIVRMVEQDEAETALKARQERMERALSSKGPALGH